MKSKSGSKPKTSGLKKKIDLIQLSDEFRRNAAFENPRTVLAIVEEARNFAVLATWHDPSNRQNDDLCEKLIENVRTLAALAKDLGASEISLPVNGDRRSPFARFFNSNVRPALADLPVKIRLRKQEYTRDLSELGPVDHNIRTALDIPGNSKCGVG